MPQTPRPVGAVVGTSPSLYLHSLHFPCSYLCSLSSVRSTKRAINRLTSSRACPEYCPSMGSLLHLLRVEWSSFSLYFGAVSAVSSPLLPQPCLGGKPNTHCVIYEVRKVKKINGNGNLSWVERIFTFVCLTLPLGTTASAVGGKGEDCEITRWRLLCVERLNLLV